MLVSVGAGLAAVLLVALAPATGRADLARWLTVAAVVLAMLTVVAAVGTLVLRSRRALPAVVTGSLLVAATVLTASSAVLTLVDGPSPAPAPEESLAVAISGVGEAASLTVRAELPQVAAGDVVRAEVTAGADQLVVARQLTVARGDGPVVVTLEAPGVGAYDSVQVLVESPDRRCTANVRPMISEAPVASCRAR